jgi:sugar phosphate isomerase/epimerase
MQANYCLNTSTIRNCGLNIQQKIELTSKAGYKGIELWVSEIEEYLKNGGNLSKLKTILDTNSITVPNLIAFFQWANPDKNIRAKALEEAKQVFNMAKALNCAYVAAPPSGITDMPDLPIADVAEYYKGLLIATQDMEAKPLLEFWGHSKKLGSLAEAIEIIEILNNSEIVILFDIFHSAKTEGSFDLIGKLKGNQIGLIHVNDYPYADDIRQLKDSQRVYPGDGVAPLDKIINTLKQIGYSGMFSLELFNEEYEKAGAETVLKTGIEKMKNIFV